ncbi:MAG: hypothetical protein J6S98_05320 [Lentisphaeria bacterium]|nr:hypothetical protein [Lentisphaeria bacterium]
MEIFLCQVHRSSQQTCADTCTNTCADTCTNTCADTCTNTCADTCARLQAYADACARQHTRSC